MYEIINALSYVLTYGPNDDVLVLVQVMTWCYLGNKHLPYQ